MSSEDDETRVDATELVVHAIIDRFTRRWQEDSSYRIERVLEEAAPIAEEHHVHLEAKDILKSLKMKLIVAEVTARSSIGETVQEDEYCRRFPDLQEAIRQFFSDRSHTPPGEDGPPLFSDDGDLPDKLDRDGIVKVRAEASQAGDIQYAIDRQGHRSIPDKVGPYENLQLIGKGSFGAVFRAFDSGHQREVALKFPRQHVLRDASHLTLFLEEAAKTQNLDHPGVVPTYATERIDGYVFTVQKLIDGHTLQDELNEKRTRSYEEIARLVAALADALAHASEKGIIHRDLKPANILIDSSDQPHIGDFGMALDENEQLGAHNVRCGTIPYMSPLLANGLTRNLDGRTDIWSLGVIFYQLLTRNRKPFRGRSNEEILEQIQTRDPKPPRQVVPAVPRELERICLKCLEKPARDRYLTAVDLADDLRAWLSHPVANESDEGRQKIVPRGLRAYRQEDASFFLRLLPGPYDREGLPNSLRFWLNQFDPATIETERSPVGILYGPTGSGKSSLVRAGLLPRLHRTDVVLIESTVDGTEESLKQALAQKYPQTAQLNSLVDVMEGLSKKTIPHDRKTLIVLDQFEQRLSRDDEYTASELANALSFCDGDNVQTLLCVRDDFWLALTRFADSLEMDLREGVNAQSIDLFGTRHAMKVLGDLGRAYGCLPEAEEQRSEDQQEFLRQAIEQLSVGGMVVCIQLVLLTELFRNRPWTTDELQNVGGVHGVAKRFLEETFDSPQATRRLRMHSNSIKRLLERLLPEAQQDLLKTEAVAPRTLELAIAESGDPVPIETLIGILHDELRLISQTEDGDGVGYQLTHDFLVDPIREWIFQDLRGSASGRARLRLRELAALLPSESAIPKNLPSHWEWLNWQYLLRNHRPSPREERILTTSRKRFWNSTLIALLILAIFLTPAYLLYREYETQQRADQISSLWTSSLIEELPASLPQLIQLQPRLQETLQELAASDVPEKELRGRLGLLPSDAEQLDRILELLLAPDSTPQQIEASSAILVSLKMDIRERLQLLIPELPVPGNRLRASALSVQVNPLDVPAASEYAVIAEGLAAEPAETHWGWIELLQRINDQDKEFGSEILSIFLRLDGREDTAALAKAAFRYLPAEQRAERMFARLGDYSDYQFQSLINVFLQYEGREELLNYFEAADLAKDDSPRKRAARAIVLFRLGKTEDYGAILQDPEDLMTRSIAILFSNPTRLPFPQLRNFYRTESDSSALLKQAVLLAFDSHMAAFDTKDLVWLDATIRRTAINDPNANCLAAAEYLARKRGIDVLALRQQRRANAASDEQGILGNVLMSKALIPFVIMEVDGLACLPGDGLPGDGKRRLAIAMYELSNRAMLRFYPDFKASQKPFERPITDDDVPFTFMQFDEFLMACNQLSEFDELQAPYPEPSQYKMISPPFPSQEPGYRIIPEETWNQIADQSLQNYLPEGKTMTRRYCRFFGGEQDTASPVGSFLPDHHGFFDLYGNGRELGLRWEGEAGEVVGFGSAYRHEFRTMFAHKLADETDQSKILTAQGYVQGNEAIFRNYMTARLCRWLD